MEKEELLNNLYEDCIEQLNNIGIDFDDKDISICIAKRNNKRYGCCRPEIPDEHYKTVISKGFKYIIKFDNYKKYYNA